MGDREFVAIDRQVMKDALFVITSCAKEMEGRVDRLEALILTVDRYNDHPGHYSEGLAGIIGEEVRRIRAARAALTPEDR